MIQEVLNYSNGFGNPSGFNEWYSRQKELNATQDELEHIIDYLVANPKNSLTSFLVTLATLLISFSIQICLG